MAKAMAILFGVAMFTMGAFSAGAVHGNPGQQPRAGQVDQSGSAPDVFIPQRPVIGTRAMIAGSNGNRECKVLTVLREWVKCDSAPTWRNLYTGAAYTLPEE